MASIKLLNNLDQNILDIEVPCQFGRETGELTFPEDDSVSTLHAEFILSEGSIFLSDLGSTNGTFLNDQRIEPHQKMLLQDDDLIEFGEQTFHIGISESFKVEGVQDRYQEKKTERLREILNASKTEKINSINSKIKTLEMKKNQIVDQLSALKEKFKKGKTAERSLIEKKSIIDQNVTNFPEIQRKKFMDLDQKKRSLFKEKTDLDDQIKLLTLSGEDNQKINELTENLVTLKNQIDLVSEEKKIFPKKLDALKKNQIIMDKTILETSLKLKKVDEVIKQNENKYNPIIEKINIQLEQLNREKSKLEGDHTSTKTRQL